MSSGGGQSGVNGLPQITDPWSGTPMSNIDLNALLRSPALPMLAQGIPGITPGNMPMPNPNMGSPYYIPQTQNTQDIQGQPGMRQNPYFGIGGHFYMRGR